MQAAFRLGGRVSYSRRFAQRRPFYSGDLVLPGYTRDHLVCALSITESKYQIMSTASLDVGAPKPELVAEVEALKKQLSNLEVCPSIEVPLS